MKRRVFIGLGSNMGDRREYLRLAVSALPDVVAVSSVWETEPVDVGGEQEPYLNAVVELYTEVSSMGLLAHARAAERAADRVRLEKNGPRTLDVDILLIGDEQIDTPELTVPHPRMWQRRFVLAPLAELAPELVDDDWAKQATGEVWEAGSL